MYFDSRSFVQLSIDNVYTGSSDFTIEFFVRPSSSLDVSQKQTIFYIGRQAIADTYKFIGSLIAIESGKRYTMSVQLSTLGTYNFGELVPDKWHHVAIMRFGNTMYFYLNGFSLNYKNIPQDIPASTPGPGHTTYLSGPESALTIGGKYDGSIKTGQTVALIDSFVGHITNFRWTKGEAVYTDHIGVPPVINVNSVFKIPALPLHVHSYVDVNSRLHPYVSVGLLAESETNVIFNTRTPTATVSSTDGYVINTSLYNPVAWRKI
jgi:hypothetical protein